MSKKLLTILFCICVFSVTFADDYVIGDLNSTSTNSYIPLYGYANYGWSKFFFTSAELQAAGMSGNVQFTQIGFQLGGGTWNNYVTDNQQVYIRYFYDATYPSSPTYPGNTSTQGFTQVFNGSISWNGPGWFFITLNAPYEHNTNWGMEILWENRDGTKTSSPPKFIRMSTDNYSSAYKYQDGSFPTSSGSRVQQRPNIWFVTPATDVPNPAIMPNPADAATGVDIASNISWSSGGGNPDEYLFSLWTIDPLNYFANNVVTTSTTYDPAMYLDYGTTYYWRVIPRNSFGPATACPTWSFTTMADPSIVDFPWMENFNAGAVPPNSNWQLRGGVLQDPIVLGGSSMWAIDDWLNISGNTDKAARINIWGNINGWLITPLIYVTDESHYLTFDLAFLKYNQPPTGTPAALNGTDDRFAVLIGDGFTWSTANIVREWNNAGSPYVLNEISSWGEKVIIPLAGNLGRVRIAFYAGSTISNADNDFMVNNIYVGAYLMEPELSISMNTAGTAKVLSWTEVPFATGYQVFYSDTPDGTWNLLDTTTGTVYEDVAASDKRFYHVKAVN